MLWWLWLVKRRGGRTFSNYDFKIFFVAKLFRVMNDAECSFCFVDSLLVKGDGVIWAVITTAPVFGIASLLKKYLDKSLYIRGGNWLTLKTLVWKWSIDDPIFLVELPLILAVPTGYPIKSSCLPNCLMLTAANGFVRTSHHTRCGKPFPSTVNQTGKILALYHCGYSTHVNTSNWGYSPPLYTTVYCVGILV